MDYTRLGKTGLTVSRICLGCMGFGTPAPGTKSWLLNEDETGKIIGQALELGINFFDTANVYAAGSSEEFVGRALKSMAKRDEIVLATKVFFPVGEERRNTTGLSRKAIFTNVDASLKRLGTDYIDLYQIHRWDYKTPIEETMEALHDVVKAGKVRYIGASAMKAYQFMKALATADLHGWTRFVTMQNHLNLIYREEEREMLPLCEQEGIGVIPYSPLAGGRLTRDMGQSTLRDQTDKVLHLKYDASAEADRPIIERVAKIAADRGLNRATVGLAWVLQKAEVSAPIVGATKPVHLTDAIAALSVKLTPEELASLEEPYVPHAVVGALPKPA